MTRCIDPDETGRIFAFLSSIESIGNLDSSNSFPENQILFSDHGKKTLVMERSGFRRIFTAAVKDRL